MAQIMNPTARRRAVTLIELMAAMAIMSVLCALTMMALQRVREAARVKQCKERLRSLALGIHAFESTQQQLPPGTNSIPYRIRWESYRLDTQSPHFWMKYKSTSYLVYLLPYLEMSSLADLVPTSMMSTTPFGAPDQWFGATENYADLNRQAPSEYYCPSDDMNSPRARGVRVAGGSQPVYRGAIGNDLFSWHEHLDTTLSAVQFQGTNYLGCSGAVSGGRSRDPVGESFRGIMTSGERQRMSDVRDGSSHTILCGESLGTIESWERVMIQPWYTGGLARTRGRIPFGAWTLPEFRSIKMLGNRRDSFAFGFGSSHPVGVNFAFGDGSVRMIARTMNPEGLSQLGGAFDGHTGLEF